MKREMRSIKRNELSDWTAEAINVCEFVIIIKASRASVFKRGVTLIQSHQHQGNDIYQIVITAIGCSSQLRSHN